MLIYPLYPAGLLGAGRALRDPPAGLFANEYENDFIKAMVGRSAKVAENDRVRKKRELDGLLARDGELDMLFERLYEDNVSGKIDDARFAKMSKRYEQEQGENAKKIKALRLELKKLEDKRMDVDIFLETVRRYTDATTITKRMVAELIQYIEVYPAVKEDGVTNQRVTIHYNCIGAFEVPDRRKIPERDILMETRKGVAFKLRPNTDRHIDLEIKNAEYHQQTFSDPLMILRMVRVTGLEPAAS